MPGPININGIVKCGCVYLNYRVAPDTPVLWTVPAGTVFILTDMVVQNRAPGDLLVNPGQFTRFAITTASGDVFFHVVENDTLNLHFRTGIPVPAGTFQFLNVANSTAPFVEFHITGRLEPAS